MNLRFLELALAGTTLSFAVPARADGPIQCANHGESCNQPPETGGAMYTMSYGEAAGYFLVTTENVRQVRCTHNAVGGDPVAGKAKQCRTTQVSPSPQYTWKTCAQGDRGARCRVNAEEGDYVLARYGTPNGDRWVYAHVASDFDCRLHGLGLDIDPAAGVQKECQIADKVFSTQGAKWKICASNEGQVCNLPSDGTYLIRYGDAGSPPNARSHRFWYKTFDGSKFTCKMDTFLWDPAPGVSKYCAYLRVPRIKSVVGRWIPLTNCTGCTSTQYSVSTGVEGGSESTKSQEWAAELSVSVTAGMEMEAPGAKVSGSTTVTASVSHAVASSIAKSFTMSKGKSQTYDCAEGALYQWQTSVEEFCYDGFNCTVIADSPYYECRKPSEGPPTQPPDAAPAATPAAAPAAAPERGAALTAEVSAEASGKSLRIHCQGGLTLRITDASYGSNCTQTAAGNDTKRLTQLCGGKPTCSMTPDHKTIGDPKPGCAKDYVVTYQCR